MTDLIEALTIMVKYANPKYPCVCEHDVLYVHGIGRMSEADEARVAELGFDWDEGLECWSSFRFGSA
jgi:hypothetical protein